MWKYATKVQELFSILEKLLKVIQHSDPSAEKLKKIVYAKYQEKLIDFAGEIKSQFLWDEIKTHIRNFSHSHSFSVEEKEKNHIVKRLLKDLENELLEKMVLPEFTKSPLQPKRAPKRKVRPIVSPPPGKVIVEETPAATPYTIDGIMEMALITKQKVEAKRQLSKIIEAIHRIGPENIEKKINSIAGKKENS